MITTKAATLHRNILCVRLSPLNITGCNLINRASVPNRGIDSVDSTATILPAASYTCCCGRKSRKYFTTTKTTSPSHSRNIASTNTDPSPFLKFSSASWSRKRCSSTATASVASAESLFEDTPLSGAKAASLLRRLDAFSVMADDDHHPIAVYTISQNDDDAKDEAIGNKKERTPLLLLHGRTWSSLPVYHLMGGARSSDTISGEHGSRSLMEALYNTHEIQPYAMDFRGFGGTPKDDSGFVEPSRCVLDVVSVLNWMTEREKERNKISSACEKKNNDSAADSDDESDPEVRPALLGWSHGAMIAQLVAQRHHDALSKLILYASIYNPNIKYPIPPPIQPLTETPTKGHTDHDDFPLFSQNLAAIPNEFDGAMEDFTNIGPPIPARQFAEAALLTDPIKVQWWNLHQFNECHPSLVKVPTMVIAGDMDPYASMATQVELFTNLGKGVDRVWSVIGDADHAVHLSEERGRFVEKIRSFLG
ncbi:hypothetical protein ACHAXS_013530 [Conticribra weissflogii]